jgi:hypothetical protein
MRSRREQVLVALAVVLLLVLLVVRFWKRSDFTFGEVRGKVTYKGQPLPEGTVMFVAQTSGLAAAGTIQSDGSYRLLSRADQDGATVGKHKVAVIAPYQPQTPNYPLFPKEYQDPDVSGFEVVVQKGENVFDFNLLEKKKR